MLWLSLFHLLRFGDAINLQGANVIPLLFILCFLTIVTVPSYQYKHSHYKGNPHTWKDGLYVESGSRFKESVKMHTSLVLFVQTRYLIIYVYCRIFLQNWLYTWKVRSRLTLIRWHCGVGCVVYSIKYHIMTSIIWLRISTIPTPWLTIELL